MYDAISSAAPRRPAAGLTMSSQGRRPCGGLQLLFPVVGRTADRPAPVNRSVWAAGSASGEFRLNGAFAAALASAGGVTGR